MDKGKFVPTIPVLNLEENREMLMDFIAEAIKHLLNAKNYILILDTVPDDRESIDNIFKTFHTIKGLADFLSLEDIRSLTHEAETLMDMVRKNTIKMNSDEAVLTSQTIDGLYKLIELLNEQVMNNGQLKSPYYDAGTLIRSLKEITVKAFARMSGASGEFQRDIPVISVDADGGRANRLSKVSQAAAMSNMSENSFAKLSMELEETRCELERAQGKLAERQREMIKDRELAIKLTQQAQAMARTKSEYLATMAHEIRTLINAILGFANLIKSGSLTAKQRDHLETITLSGNLLLGIVNDILDFSKVEVGKLQLEKINFSLEPIVEETFKIIRTRLDGKPINLFYEIEENVPPHLLGDPTRIKQIFLNLLENAIKFTEKGEIGLTVQCQESAAFVAKGSKLRTIQFIIEDTGIGIPPERKNAIFDSFTQADSSTTRVYGGSGLGLTLCKNYVEAMGGEIFVESVIGQGSRFIFTIDFEVGSTSGLSASVMNPDLQGKKVIIVDTHEKSQRRLQLLCHKYQLNTVGIFKTPQEILELLLIQKTKTLPHLIFIDMMFPEKGAITLVSKIRQDKHYENIKLIAVSADIRIDIADKMYTQGFNEFLPKPFIPSEFINVLESVFGYKTKGPRVLSQDMLEKISCEGLRVLVVEDSLPNQELLKVHLESLGCIVEYAGNGQQAIEKFKNSGYDICFMDLQMPVMGGLEATEIIRTRLKSDIPIVALTAAAQSEEQAKCLGVGMTDYLAKPFDLFELKEKIVRSTKM